MAALPENLKKEYQEQWQAVVQNEGGKDAHQKLKALGENIATVSGNKNASDLTDADFKAFGLSKQEYDTVLSRLAMNNAVSSFKRMTSSRSPDLFNGMKDMEGLLADTEYAKKGGLRHATEVMLSLSGTGVSAAGFDGFKKEIGRLTAEQFGNDYRNGLRYGQRSQVAATGLLDALSMAGETPDDATIKKYTGESKQEFDDKMRDAALLSMPRGGVDRHFEMFMQLNNPRVGRGK